MILTWLYLPPFLRLLAHSRLCCTNYAGHVIPTSAGLILSFTTTFTVALALLWNRYPPHQAAGFIIVVNGFALVGLLDDVVGGKGTKGWRGHLRTLRFGRLSTGMIKVLYGGALALAVASAKTVALWDLILNASLIALGAALFNQLDVRPARATVTFVSASFLLGWGGGWTLLSSIAPLVGAALVYLPFDKKGHAMLGDSGANALGAAWGWAAGGLPYGHKWSLLLLALAFHVVGEGYSLQGLTDRILRRKQG